MFIQDQNLVIKIRENHSELFLKIDLNRKKIFSFRCHDDVIVMSSITGESLLYLICCYQPTNCIFMFSVNKFINNFDQEKT